MISHITPNYTDLKDGAYHALETGISSILVAAALSKWQSLPPVNQWVTKSFFSKQLQVIHTHWNFQKYWQIGPMLATAAFIDFTLCKVVFSFYKTTRWMQKDVQLYSQNSIDAPLQIKTYQPGMPNWLKTATRITALVTTYLIFANLGFFAPSTIAAFSSMCWINTLQSLITTTQFGLHASTPILTIAQSVFYPKELSMNSMLIGVFSIATTLALYIVFNKTPLKINDVDYHYWDLRFKPVISTDKPSLIARFATTPRNQLFKNNDQWQKLLDQARKLNDKIQKAKTFEVAHDLICKQQPSKWFNLGFWTESESTITPTQPLRLKRMKEELKNKTTLDEIQQSMKVATDDLAFEVDRISHLADDIKADQTQVQKLLNLGNRNPSHLQAALDQEIQELKRLIHQEVVFYKQHMLKLHQSDMQVSNFYPAYFNGKEYFVENADFEATSEEIQNLQPTYTEGIKDIICILASQCIYSIQQIFPSEGGSIQDVAWKCFPLLGNKIYSSFQ